MCGDQLYVVLRSLRLLGNKRLVEIGGNRELDQESPTGVRKGEGCWDSGERNRLEMELKDGLKTQG